MPVTESQVISFKCATIAYLLAISSAALAFTFLFEGVAMISSSGFESATTNSFLTKTAHLSIMTLLLFLIGWLFACATALVPFAIGVVIANHFKVTHWFYFVAGAAITAVAVSPLYLSIPNLNVQEPELTFQEQFFQALPFFIVLGSIGGFACWGYLNRQFSSAKV